jgi:cell division protein FtsB
MLMPPYSGGSRAAQETKMECSIAISPQATSNEKKMTTITEHLQPRLDMKKIPAALVAAFLLQTAGALFWAGSAANRISVLERTVSGEQAAIAQVAVLEEQVREMREQLGRIETKLDRLQAAAPAPHLSPPVYGGSAAAGGEGGGR